MGVGGIGGRGHIQGHESEPVMPRAGWQDEGALERAVDDSRAAVDASRSRPNHRTKWADAKRPGTTTSAYGTGTESHALAARMGAPHAAHASRPSHPVIVAKYGIPHPGGAHPTHPTRPVIVAKYGIPSHPVSGGGKPTHPVITPKYGIFPHPGGGGGKPTQPVIVAKYGIFQPGHGGGGKPTQPVIVAKYGIFPPHRK